MEAAKSRFMATNILRVSGDRAKHGEELAVADLSAALEAADRSLSAVARLDRCSDIRLGLSP